MRRRKIKNLIRHPPVGGGGGGWDPPNGVVRASDRKKMTKMIIFAAVLAVVLVVAAGAVVFYSPKIDKNSYKKAEVLIGSNKFMVEVAETAAQMALGLGGRESLGEREGMLFLYNPPARPVFWMKGMKFPIDIVWIRDGVVVEVVKNVQPGGFWKGERFSPEERVNMVLEVGAGVAEALGVKKESRLEVRL